MAAGYSKVYSQTFTLVMGSGLGLFGFHWFVVVSWFACLCSIGFFFFFMMIYVDELAGDEFNIY